MTLGSYTGTGANRSITGQVIGLDGGQHLAWRSNTTVKPDAE